MIVLVVMLIPSAWAIDLKVGDILLQPLHCFACTLIEEQTRSEYSHVGVVIKVERDNIFVAEAYQKVKLVSLSEFTMKTQKKSWIKVMRPNFVNQNLYSEFLQIFNGLPYDAQFLFDDDKIYCSELLYKLFERLNMDIPKLKVMTFDINRELWLRFFHGKIPDGELGISPKDFDDSKIYNLIGFI